MPAPETPRRHLFDSVEQELYLNLWRTYDCLKGAEDQVMVRFGVSAQQYNLLRILKATYPESVPTLKLGRRLISRSPDITRMLDRLEENGWIQRERLPTNRRVVQVGLTAAGLEHLEQMSATIIDMHQRQLGHLTDEQQLQLLKLLKLAREPLEDGSCGWISNGR